MRTENDQTMNNLVSRSSSMNDSQKLNGLDFIPKSDHDGKCRLENKRPLHKQQLLEGEKCETERNCKSSPVTVQCKLCQSVQEKAKSKTEINTLKKKSGDWKLDDELAKPSSDSIAVECVTSEWRYRNPYSISDFGRSKRWCRRTTQLSGDSFSASVLRDLRTIDTRYKDPLKDDMEKNFLQNFRDYLVNCQQSCGVSSTEYSFSSLIGAMGRATGRSLLALLYVMLNVIPVMEVFLHLLRFILDNVIKIRSSKDIRQTIIRCFVFTTELFSIYVCLIFIFGFIVLPITHMAVDIIAKIMLYN